MSDDASEERKKLIYRSRLAEHCERYEDMVEDMKTVALHYPPLDVEERNLMSVGYKNVVGQRRTAYRTFRFMLESKNKSDTSLEEYLKRIEDELDEKCNEIICEILTPEFIEKHEKTGDKVFYMKMKGDYYRYMAEYKKDEERKEVSEKSLQEYQKALEVSSDLEPTDTIKLGLALNYSVFYYEILKEHVKAIDLAKDAFQNAKANIDQLQESEYNDATLILQLLRDNLNLWQTETEVDDPGPLPENDD